MPKYHVLRIHHDEATDIKAVRAGEVIEASDHNAAADKWAVQHSCDFSRWDHFDLVVMDEPGKHIHLDVSMTLAPVMRLSDYQGLDG